LDDYHIPEAVRLTREFLDDLSRWYIRRGRERLKNGDLKALSTLYRVLVLFTKTTSPLIPFITEKIYKEMVNEKESVHLEDWPRPEEELINEELEEKMKTVREIAAQALAKRATAGIKVRQPLSVLKIKNEGLRINEDLLNLIKEEVNVKEIVFDGRLEDEIKLELEVSSELKQEGDLREVIRNIQEMRKLAGLRPGDKIVISYCGSKNYYSLVDKNKPLILKETFGQSLLMIDKKKTGLDSEKEMVFGEDKLWLAIKRV
jgi:isoleucyl-tRNA synthetase